MDDVLKQRLVGAAVLIALAVIFVPMLFDGPRDERLERTLDPTIPTSPMADEEVTRLPLNPNASRVSPERSATPRPEPSPAPAESASSASGSTRIPLADEAGGADDASEAEATPPSASAEAVTPDVPAPEPESAPTVATEAEPAAAPTQQAPLTGWRVQVASFGREQTAQDIAQQLTERGHQVQVDRIERGASVLYRIQTGPYDDRQAAEGARQTISEQVAGVSPVIRAPEDSDASSASIPPGFAVQVGSFTSQANAERLQQTLLDQGFEVFSFVEPMGSRNIWRVRVGTVADREAAEALQAQLRRQAGLEGLVVSHP